MTAALDLKIIYRPQGGAVKMFECRDDEVLLAGPAGTGKSYAWLQKLHLAMSKYPKAKGLMSRKTRQSMTNSCIDMFERHIIKPPDKVRIIGGKNVTEYNYPNGSMIAVAGFDDPEKIKSTDWDMIYVQEATELSENDWEIATTRLRSFIMPYQQIGADCNPDRPTHWLKKRCDNGLTKLIPSVHKDNPVLWDQRLNRWTKYGEKYIGKLERLTGARFHRLFKGLWVSSEGLVYENWDPQIHCISSVDLPKDHMQWPHYWSIDWGYMHPFVWSDWIENPQTHQLIRLQYIYCTQRLVEDLAKHIKEITKGHPPRAIICDHDLEDRMVFERHTGYPTLPAYKNINTGVQAVEKRLDPNWCQQGPGLLFVRGESLIKDDTIKAAGNPTSTEEEMDGYVWDEDYNLKVNSKKDELPVDKDNHGLDETRYQIAFHDDLAIDPQEFEAVTDMIEENDFVHISPY